MPPRFSRFLLFTALLNLATAVQAQESTRPAPRFSVAPTASRIDIDGILDEDAWQSATVISLPYEYFPGDNTAAPVKTECLVTYDDGHLYVAFRAFDPNPDAIRAHLMDRDDIQPFVQDDHVGLLLDTFNDERRAFQLRINPLGVQADAMFSELEGFEDFSWDIIWNSAGRITDDGYVVEVAVPFNQLRFPGTEGPQTWGFEAFRSYPRSVRHRIASHVTDRNRSCIICQINKVDGFDGISPGRNVELSPTVASLRTDTRPDFPTGSFDTGRIDVQPGFSARWGVTPNVVLNGTVNPDFSQVEADAAQLDVNNRFVLFFEEKRPFFLEGADFFLTPLQAVFTRTVADPIAGAKVTGKSGRNALGVFATQDRVNTLILPSNQGSAPTTVDQDVTGGVLRYRRDVGNGSTLGLLYTGRTGTGYYNHTGGVDGFLRLSPSNTVRFQYLVSTTDYPAAVETGFGQETDAFHGGGGLIEWAHRSRLWWVDAGYQDLASTLRGDYGFFQRVDVRTAEASVQRIFRGQAGSWLSQLNLGVAGSRTGNHDGSLTDQSFGLTTFYSGPLQAVVNASASLNKERFAGVMYGLNRVEVFGTMQPTGRVHVSLFARLGDQIDFTNQQEATELVVQPGIGLKIGRALNLSVDNTTQRIRVAAGRLFTANITQGKIRYNFNVRSFVRLILQYRTVERTVANYNEALQPLFAAHDQSLFTQLLFSYKLNPQTVLFLGYSDTYLGTQAYDLTQADRTFFFKVGYALVL